MPTTASVPYINERLGTFALVKEITQGERCWSLTASGGSGTTVTVDTTSGNTHDNNLASMADDHYNGAQIRFLSSTSTSALRGKVYNVSDSALSGGTVTLTVNTMAATPSSGDVFYIFWPVKGSNISMGLNVENIERDFVRNTLDKPSSLAGLKTASVSFEVEIPGLENVASDGVAPTVDVYGGVLSAIGARSTSVGEAVSGSSSTTSAVDVTDASTFSVGQHVLINKQLVRITALDTASTPNNLTVSPALSAAPAASDLVYTGETWTPDDQGHQSFTILYQKDDRLMEVRGIVASVRLDAEFGNYPRITFEGDGAYQESDGTSAAWDMQDAFTELDAEHPAKLPQVYTKCSARHFGTTTMSVASVSFDLGHERAEHRYCGSHFYSITARNATCAVNFKDTSVNPKESWELGKTQDHLLIGIGNTAGNVVAVAGNAQAQEVGMENNNEFSDYSATFAFVDDQTDVDSPKKPLLIRF